jgi:hypothetical protein
MKSFIIAFILALMVSCLMGGYNAPPTPQPIGITDKFEERPAGVRHDDFMYGDMKLTDGHRPMGVQTTVFDGSNMQNRIDFPSIGTGNN